MDNPISAPLSGETKVVGVFGYPVAHSLSPAMHNSAFAALGLNWVYVPFPVPPERVGAAIQSLAALGVVGVNLTIPHKELVLPYIDELTQEARDIRAVNTVHVVDGGLVGDNTDGRGFWEPLREQGFSVAGESVFVLGAGGAARSVVFRLLREGAKVALMNRTRERAERLALDAVSAGLGEILVISADDTETVERAVRNSKLLVQTTKAGMRPEIEGLPGISLSALHPDLTVYDLVYNPVKTRLLAEAEARGCATMTGVKMLVYQGAIAFQRWTGVFPPTDVMERAVLRGLNPAKGR